MYCAVKLTNVQTHKSEMIANFKNAIKLRIAIFESALALNVMDLPDHTGIVTSIFIIINRILVVTINLLHYKYD